MPERERRLWWAAFAAVWILCALWAFASPLVSAPDEDAHVIKAAALVSGQLRGRTETVRVVDAYGPPRQDTWFLLPSAYGGLRDQRCYAFNPAITPACAPDLPAGPAIETRTHVGAYPPLYYAAVGWPALFLDTAPAVYAMRLLSAAISAALVASAFVSIVRIAPAGALVGLILALPPMALYLFGTVNPSSFEIAGAVATWASAAALLLSSAPPTTREVLRAAAAIVLLAAARPSGPVVAASILATVIAAFASPARLRALARSRVVRAGALVTALLVALCGAWMLLVDMPLSGVGSPGMPLATRLRYSAELLPFRTGQLVGRFGWLDTPMPAALVWLWMVAVAMLLGLGLWRGTWRERAVLAALAVAVPTSAVFVEALLVPQVGLMWQGRYSLAVFAGVPIVAAVIAARTAPDPSAPRGIERAAMQSVVIGAAFLHIIGFWVAMSRYTVGGLGWLSWIGPRQWEPPGGAIALATLFAVVAAATASFLATWMLRSRTGARP